MHISVNKIGIHCIGKTNCYYKCNFYIISICYRVIHEIADQTVVGKKWQLLAIQILHEVCEMYLCSLFADSNLAGNSCREGHGETK